MPSSEVAAAGDAPAAGVACADARLDDHGEAPDPQPQPTEAAVKKVEGSGDDSDEESSEEESSEEDSSDEDSDEDSEADSANEQEEVRPGGEQAAAAPESGAAEVGEEQPAAEAATPAARADKEEEMAVGPEEATEAATPATSPEEAVEAASSADRPEEGPATVGTAVANVEAPDVPQGEADASVDNAAPPPDHSDAMQPDAPTEAESSAQPQPGVPPTADVPAEARGIKAAESEVVPSAAPDAELLRSEMAAQEQCQQTDHECAVTDDDADDEMEDLMKSSDGEQSARHSTDAPSEQTSAAQAFDAARKHPTAAAPGQAASAKPAQGEPVGMSGRKGLLALVQPRSSPAKSRSPPQRSAANVANKAVLTAAKPRAPRLPTGHAGRLPAIAQQASTAQQRGKPGAAEPATPTLPKISSKQGAQQQQPDSDQHAVSKEKSFSLLAYATRPGVGQMFDWQETHRLNGLAESKRAAQRRMQRVAEATKKTEEVNAESDRAFKQWLHNKGMEQQLEKSRQRVLQKAAMISTSLYWDDANERQQRERGWMDNFGSSVNVSRAFGHPGAARLAGHMEPDGTKSEPDISVRCVPKPRIMFNE